MHCVDPRGYKQSFDAVNYSKLELNLIPIDKNDDIDEVLFGLEPPKDSLEVDLVITNIYDLKLKSNLLGSSNLTLFAMIHFVKDRLEIGLSRFTGYSRISCF